MGRRPHVRGSVIDPVDHPHGGGERKISKSVEKHQLHLGVNLL